MKQSFKMVNGYNHRGFNYKGENFFIGDIFQQHLDNTDIFYILCEGDVCFYLEQLTSRKSKIIKAIVDERCISTNEVSIERIYFGDFKRIGNSIDNLELVDEILDNIRRCNKQ